MMTQGCRVWLGVLFACLTWFARASESPVVPETVVPESDTLPVAVQVVGPDNAYTADFKAALAKRLDSSMILTGDAGSAKIVLALGEKAFAEARILGTPVIGVHISPAILQAARDAGCQCSAIYRHATTADQILVLREMLPAARRVGVLIGPGFDGDEKSLDASGILFERRRVAGAAELPAVLAELLPRVDVLLALPDPALYNAETARLVLLSSYRQGKPVIGPDEQFVRAGSLAAAYPSVDGLLEAALVLLRHPGLPASLPPPIHARSAVAFNAHVARSYGVMAADIPAIEKRLEEQR